MGSSVRGGTNRRSPWALDVTIRSACLGPLGPPCSRRTPPQSAGRPPGFNGGARPSGSRLGAGRLAERTEAALRRLQALEAGRDTHFGPDDRLLALRPQLLRER